MADWGKILDTAIKIGGEVASNKDMTSFICGKYEDGTPRNLADALNGVYLSPKQKKKIKKRRKKRKKKKKIAKFQL